MSGDRVLKMDASENHSGDKKLHNPCRRRIMACESMEYSNPIQTEDKNSTNLSALQGTTKVQYLIASNVELDIQQPQQCSDQGLATRADLDGDDLSKSIPAAKVDNECIVESDSLEDKLCQMLVMESPEIKRLRKQLEEQRLQQQKEIEELKKQLEEQRFQQQTSTKTTRILLLSLLILLLFIAYCMCELVTYK